MRISIANVFHIIAMTRPWWTALPVSHCEWFNLGVRARSTEYIWSEVATNKTKNAKEEKIINLLHSHVIPNTHTMLQTVFIIRNIVLYSLIVSPARLYCNHFFFCLFQTNHAKSINSSEPKKKNYIKMNSRRMWINSKRYVLIYIQCYYNVYIDI